jgi:hypothetical protein
MYFLASKILGFLFRLILSALSLSVPSVMAHTLHEDGEVFV